ncbi:MAG: response regulator transcription factor [Gammaproteobacteria bacterium]|nr:response regulator transcription factor [Gammaproteobacteria bacterium]
MRLLIVDDHPLFLDGLESSLCQLDPTIKINKSVNAEQALQNIAAGLQLDLMLVDALLPDMSGIEFIKTLINREIWIPSLILSANENLTLVTQAMDSGAMGFVPKTYSASKLYSAMQQVMKGQMYLPDEIARQMSQLQSQSANDKLRHRDLLQKFGITARQLEVLQLLAEGFSNREIALSLFVSEHTVKSHIKAMFATLRVSNRTACVKTAAQLGLL